MTSGFPALQTPETELAYAVESIGPAEAREYLTRNHANRKVKVGAVERYARDMSTGTWAVNGEPIIFDADGNLLGGQHRLQAVIKANVPIQFLVVRGVAASVRTFNQGIPASFTDDLTHRGIANAHTVASITRWWWWYENDFPQFSAQASVEELESVRAEHAVIDFAAKYVGGIGDLRGICSPSILGFVVARVWEHGPANAGDAMTFVREIADGIGLTETDAAYHLRKRFIKNKGSKARLPRLELLALIIKAWNARATQTPIRRLLVWRAKGKAAEDFPRLIDPRENGGAQQ